MGEFIKSVRIFIVVICLALFSVGIIWNLFYDTIPKTMEKKTAVSITAEDLSEPQPIGESQTKQWERQYTAAKQEADTENEIATAVRTSAPFVEQKGAAATNETKVVEDRIAALRMERDSSWRKLEVALESLDFDQKQQCLKQYKELQYQEQRLEVLLKAKGIANCLVLLEQQQANIIATDEALSQQYEKIFDLVERNTDYSTKQILLVPLAKG